MGRLDGKSCFEGYKGIIFVFQRENGNCGILLDFALRMGYLSILKGLSKADNFLGPLSVKFPLYVNTSFRTFLTLID